MVQTAGTIRIGKEVLAAGLFWQPAASAALAVREARIVAAKAELAADVFCVRRQGVVQFGLGQRNVGHRPAMRAVAPVLATAVEAPSWAGVFRVDEGWLTVLVRKGAVMPDGDLLLATEGEARERLLSELASGGWNAVFAPADWQIAGARWETLGALVRPGTDARLRLVAGNPRAAVLWIGGVAAAGLALWTLMSPSAPPAPPVPNVPLAPPPAPPPWEGQWQVTALIKACETAIEATDTIPGYELEAVSCGAAGVTARYRRRWGSLAWLPGKSSVSSPDHAVVTAGLSGKVGRRSGEERPWAADKLRRTIWGAAQTYLLDSELKDGPVPPPADRAADQPPPFRSVTVSLGGKLPPAALASLLAQIPTFVVEEVSWEAMTWRVKGKAYVL